MTIGNRPHDDGATSDSAEADRRALFELLLAEEGLQSVAHGGIPKRDDDGPPRLSYAQERLWFLQQFEDDTSALGVRAAVKIDGAIDVELLGRCVDAVLERHEILRTLIVDVVGEPAPQVLAAPPTPLIVDDLRTSSTPDADIARIMHAEATRTFDLERELPIVVRLIRVTDDTQILSVVIHHIASDGRSTQVFFRDLSAFYLAFADDSSGGRPAIPELPISYLDYAAWQRDWNSETIDRQLEYWAAQLGDDVTNCELPPDHPRPAVHTVDGAQLTRTLSRELLAELRDLGQRNGATLFMTLLAAFKLVLDRRVAGDRHTVTVGTPIAGRVRPELEELIGVFLNTLVLRTDLDGDPTFTELLQRVRDTSLDAFTNQDVPFERLLAELHPTRDLSRTPFFSVFFNMMSTDIDNDDGIRRLFGHDYQVVEQPDVGSKFDLTMYVDERRRTDGDDLSMLLVYNRNLYDTTTMEDLFDQYLSLLEAVVADPDRHLSDYSLVSDATRDILPDLGEALDRTWHGAVPHLVDAQAARVPDRCAVTDTAGSWSYAQLAAQMNRLGRRLRDDGVDRGDVVAIYGHRSASLVWAVAGALAAGAAYTILDPAYPAERLCTYLRAIRPRAVIQLESAGDMPAEVDELLVELDVGLRLSLPAIASDEPLAELAGLSPTPLDVELGPDDLACITFTSGSTGRPKAVMGRHGSLTHFHPWQTEVFGVSEHDRFSMLSGLAHDPIQRDMFWPLSIGATIVVPDPDEIATPGWVARWLRDQRVTVVHLTPAMGRLILETPRSAPDASAPIPSLRVALFIGDALARSDVARLRERAPDLEVVNLYGTTETQRASGYHVVERPSTATTSTTAASSAPAVEREVLPLGTGIAGTQLLIRRPSGAFAGTGEIGEIWVRSHHLALGYLDDPDDTAAHFFATPGATEPTDRMYRTGDLGRYRADGVVEFIGRADQQVQVRGFRVELDEIRAALRRHSDIDDAVVVLRDGATRGPELVAYVVMSTEAESPPSDLLAFTREQLPAHMVPARIISIEAVPMTPNGKIDRNALPEPEEASVDTSDVARDSLEQLLVELWQDVLNRPDIGIHDDFFDLGGYSLLATRLFALIEEATGQRVPVATLFQSPTVAELAETIRNAGWTSSWSSLVPIKPGGSRRPLFYVTPYLISVLQLAHLGDELGDDQPLYGLQPQGLDGELPAHERIEDMAAHYISEMQSLQPHGPYRLGGHCSGAWVAFEMARQLEASGEEIDAVLLVDQGPPGVERPAVASWRYVWHRTKFFFLDGRLRHAIAWQLKIALNRYLLRRVGPSTVRYTEEVRAAHHLAHRAYLGGQIDSDLVLIRSAETLALEDRTWFLHWDEMTDGELTLEDVIGTHANLLEQPYVVDLASKLRAALDAGNDVSSTDAESAAADTGSSAHR